MFKKVDNPQGILTFGKFPLEHDFPLELQEIRIFTRITIPTQTAIFTKPAILVISVETIENCYFGVKRTMPGPGTGGFIDI